MSFMQKIFGTAPAQQTTPPVNQPPGAPQQQQQDNNLGTQTTAQTAPNGVVPKQEESPLSKFSDVWKNVSNPADANKSVFGDVDPAKLRQAAATVDFSKVITPETLAAINAGGEGAGKAYLESLNKVAQTVYGENAVATTKIVEQALQKQAESFQQQLPGLIKKFAISDSLRTENPFLADPAIQPIVSALETQLYQKNPNATSAEIKAQVNEYLEAVSTKFQEPKLKAAQVKEAAASGEVDWENFFTR